MSKFVKIDIGACMENLGQRKQYQNSINQLKKRKSELKKQYGQIQAKTQIVEDRIDNLRKVVRELREENVHLSQKIERKIYKHTNTLQREKNLKRDIENLEMSQVTLQTRYNQKAQEILELERKLTNLESKKSHLMEKNAQRSRAQMGMTKRKESIERKLLTLDEELKYYEAKIEKVAIDPMINIKRELRHHAGRDEKSAAILMTLINSVVRTMEENEFENLNYKSKINSSKDKLGMRIRFSGVASTHDDIKERIYPIMKAFKSFFQEYGVSLKTKVGKSNGEIVEILDMAIVMNRTTSNKITTERNYRVAQI